MNDLPQRPDAFDESQHPLWRVDRVELQSVGIDIGSATTHFIFSTLEMRRQGSALSSRFAVTERRIRHASRIIQTPFKDGLLLDVEALSKELDTAYLEAGISPDDLETGAVITTGDAARKRNASAVVALLSEQAGKFVCASAGPVLEARLAANGSGAVARSRRATNGRSVLNIDIGGGTTKLAIAKAGDVTGVTALNVGARLLTFDDHGNLNKIEPSALHLAEHLGIDLSLGKPLAKASLEALSSAMIQAIMEAARGTPTSSFARELLILEPLRSEDQFDAILISGGVSEFFYGRETGEFGDIGKQLAQDLRSQLLTCFAGTLIETPDQGIRATVIGASQFSAQVSGNTIFIARPEALPLRNVPVVPVPINPDDVSSCAIQQSTTNAITDADLAEASPVALAITWPYGPAYDGIHTLCVGLAAAIRGQKVKRTAYVVVLDDDIAMTVGGHLRQHLGDTAELICLDGIELDALDYVDVSQEDPIAKVVTVTVKSLVFTG